MVERIIRFAFALKDDRLAVWRKIAFATAMPVENELSDIGKKLCFLLGRVGFSADLDTAEAEREKEQSWEFEFHEWIKREASLPVSKP